MRFHTSTTAARYSIEIARVGARREVVWTQERDSGRAPPDAARGVWPRLRLAGWLRPPHPEGLAIRLLRGHAPGRRRQGPAPRVGPLLRRAGAGREAPGADPDDPLHQHLRRLQHVGREVPLRKRRPLGGVPALLPAAVAAGSPPAGGEHHPQHEHRYAGLRRAPARRRVPAPCPSGLPPLDAVRGLPYLGVDLPAVDGGAGLRARLLRPGRSRPGPRRRRRLPHADLGRPRRVLVVAGARRGGRLRGGRRERGLLHWQRGVLAGPPRAGRSGDGLLQVRPRVRSGLRHEAGEVPDRNVVEPAHRAARELDLRRCPSRAAAITAWAT